MFTFYHYKVNELLRFRLGDKNISQKLSLSYGPKVAPSLPCPLFLELLFQNDIANIFETIEK